MQGGGRFVPVFRRFVPRPPPWRGGLPTLPRMGSSGKHQSPTGTASLREGNALQRRYFRWASARYAAMPPPLRAQAEAVDRFLYSRQGLWVWLGLAAAMAGSALGLRAAGLPTAAALALSLALWTALTLALLGAWLVPERFTGRRLGRAVALSVLTGYAGTVAGFLLARAQRLGGLPPQLLGPELWRAARESTPFLLLALVAVTLLLWGVAQVRQAQAASMARELAALQLQRERDAAALAASQARLQLLQAQIQPHFVFNTLAALQHWVDSGDTRAPALLRQLTAFLRGSTALLGRGRTTLGEEAEVVRQYLHIMQSRLGDRLRWTLDLPADSATAPLPPGLLLTLVENAIEHGLGPTLAGGTLQVQAQRTGDWVQVRVADDGAGLDAVWEEGTGLANCRARLQHFGDGRGGLALRPLQPGTEVVLKLACMPSEEAQAAAAAEGPSPARAGSTHAQGTFA